MKKSLKISIVMISLLILSIFALTVNAATTEADLKAYLEKTHVIAGKSVSLSAADKVKLERYLETNDVTAAQADTIIAKTEEAKKVMTAAGVSDPTKLSASDKAKVTSLANEAASAVGLTVSVKSGEVTIKDSTGAVISSTSLKSGGALVYTGNNYTAYIIVVSVAVIAAAIYFITKKVNA